MPPCAIAIFRLLEAGRFITTFGSEMLTFAIGWELWIRTNSALALGMVGLVQVLPILLLSLPAGHVADQYNRRRIVVITEIGSRRLFAGACRSFVLSRLAVVGLFLSAWHRHCARLQ